MRGPLFQTRYQSTATGNSNYGWNVSGATTGVTLTSIVDRIDYSNDTSTASSRSTLTTSRLNHSATSGVLNKRRQKGGNFGWFGGGSTAGAPPPLVATVDRIDFSNDTGTASVRGS